MALTAVSRRCQALAGEGAGLGIPGLDTNWHSRCFYFTDEALEPREVKVLRRQNTWPRTSGLSPPVTVLMQKQVGSLLLVPVVLMFKLCIPTWAGGGGDTGTSNSLYLLSHQHTHCPRR